MKKIKFLFAILLLIISQHVLSNNEIPVADFVKSPAYSSAKLSPNGEYLGLIVERGSRDVLAIIDVKTLKPIRVHQAPEEFSVGAFYWVGPKRLMVTTNQKIGRFASPLPLSQWIAINFDGSQPVNLNVSSLSNKPPVSAIKKTGTIYGDFNLEDTVATDDAQVIVSIDGSVSDKGQIKEIVRLNTFTGRYESLGWAPAHNCQLVMNKMHQFSYALCTDAPEVFDQAVLKRQFFKWHDNKEWVRIGDAISSKDRISLAGESAGGKVYAIRSEENVPNSFGYLNTNSGEFELAHHDSVADISDYIVATDRRTIIGIVNEAVTPKITMLNNEHQDAEIYQALLDAFPKQFVDFGSSTLDGKKVLVSVRSEKNPGELYLYDRETKQVKFLLRNRDWLPDNQMAEVKYIRIKSRDGIDLYGYLTLPKTPSQAGYPLIVNPHGGPIGPRDSWGFNWESQLLASRGYAVLQINFRGSGGYGKAFEEMGHGEWGGKIQNDLIDATRWAIKQGYADEKRVCIYGGSFGGYSAMMAPIREPNMFKCAVGYVGVYDMEAMHTVGDIPRRDFGKKFLAKTLGKDKAQLSAISPTENADKIKIPIFLIAGALDQRAPTYHTVKMANALKKAGNPAEEVIIQKGEGHGFYDEKNNLNLYTKMLDFFDRHIGDKKTAMK
jgi:dipeptidyl aminopeptidase/acylaminoacyl peptidase